MIELKDETIFLSDDKIFYTIEGEGEYVGMPSVFMRMSMCNLTCIGFKSEDAPYGCDSYISWSIKNKMSFYHIKCMLEDNGYKDHLFNGAILKLTGGEPLIQQAKLLKFIDYLKQEWGFVPRIDFETNATIYPSDRWVDEFQATFTTSPKLKSNGDPKGKRYIEEVLDWHTMHNSGFKFVVQSHRDMEEIMTEYVDKFDIPTGRVWLMPCAGSREEHIRVAADVAELAKEYHFNFSPRLHLLLWDKALKV
jgi:7-carboxy-7-deazaguanine synthase